MSVQLRPVSREWGRGGEAVNQKGNSKKGGPATREVAAGRLIRTSAVQFCWHPSSQPTVLFRPRCSARYFLTSKRLRKTR